jgi:imidazolonepropionase-like amidohydrolase
MAGKETRTDMGRATQHLVIAGLLASMSLPCTAQTIAINAETVLPISGPAIRNGTVLVRGGKIVAVGHDIRVPSGAAVLTARVVMPGLIDAHSYLGCFRETGETADSTTPEIRVADAFDASDDALARALRSGVTTACIMPPSSSAIGGQAALVRLGRPPAVTVSSMGVKLSVSGDATDTQRNPTSRAGLALLLQKSFAAAKAGRPVSSSAQTRLLAGATPSSMSNRTAALRRITSGQSIAFLHAPTAADVELALELLRGLPDTRIQLVHAGDSLNLAGELRSKNIGIIVGSLKFSDTDKTLSQPGKLARAGVRVAFCTDAPQGDAASLRTTAHLAVKNGMSRERALRALTLDAASALGIADRTGSIVPGKDADLVLLDGDPLNLTSQVQAVISGGKIVYRGSR